MLIDRQALDGSITEAAEHYEHSAPTVATWLDELYMRLGETPDTVPITEVFMLERLLDADDGWMQPNLAANQVYKLLYRLGRDVSCQAGF